MEVKQASKHWRIFVQSSSAAAYEEKNEDDISTATLIWRAVKLPIYSVALVPLTVSLIYAETSSSMETIVYRHCHLKL